MLDGRSSRNTGTRTLIVPLSISPSLLLILQERCPTSTPIGNLIELNKRGNNCRNCGGPTTILLHLQDPPPEAAVKEAGAPEFLRWMDATQPVTTVDELKQFLNEPLVHGKINIIAWWGWQRGRLPMLTRMAMDTFLISAMSSEPERVFSSIKHIMSDERASVGSRWWHQCKYHR
jgi:hypothetical protein